MDLSKGRKLVFSGRIVFILMSVITLSICASVDYSYCKKYTVIGKDIPDYRDPASGRPIIYIGETWSKRFYLMNLNYTGDFFDSAYAICRRFDLQLATVKTACDYGIIQEWFLSQYPTTYSAWVAGFRFGNSKSPPPLWMTTGEPLDFSQFNQNAAYIPGPYPPGGYDPTPYPWVNCLSVSRNCLLWTSAPTNPCEQTSTYPDIQFMWTDCRAQRLRIICEEIVYTKEANEIDSDFESST